MADPHENILIDIELRSLDERVSRLKNCHPFVTSGLQYHDVNPLEDVWPLIGEFDAAVKAILERFKALTADQCQGTDTRDWFDAQLKELFTVAQNMSVQARRFQLDSASVAELFQDMVRKEKAEGQYAHNLETTNLDIRGIVWGRDYVAQIVNSIAVGMHNVVRVIGLHTWVRIAVLRKQTEASAAGQS